MSDEINEASFCSDDQQAETSSYRSIFKATSLFGGVQLYQILIQVIKSKFIAVLLGPSGVGVLGLFQSALDFIRQITSFGLSQSAVRDVSEAVGENDINSISKTIVVIRKLVWITGFLGLIVVAALSPLLSKFSFGNYVYTASFILLSVTLLLDQISSGQKVILQGTRRLKDLAKASSIGVTLGLLVSIPLYYWFGIDGIVPTIILNSVFTLFLSWYFARKIPINKVQITNREALRNGYGMLKMGLAMCVSGFETSLLSYIVRGYISNLKGAEYVGLYTAGALIISTYFGMVFSAMGTDYYPRLAKVNKDNAKCRVIVNQQGEIASLILCPLMLLSLVYMPLIIRLLYSEEFILATEYISIATIGMMFRLGAWLISLQFVAKGESKLFIINETISNVYSLIIKIVLFNLYGLKGLGISFLVGYIIYFIQVYLVAKKRYEFHFSKGFYRLYLFQIALCIIGFLIVSFTDGIYKYLFGSILIVLSLSYSLWQLNNKMGIVNMINNKFRNR